MEPSPSFRDPGGVGGSTSCGLVHTPRHVRRAGKGWVQRNTKEQVLTALPSAATCLFTGQGLVRNQDLEEQQQPTHCSQDIPS